VLISALSLELMEDAYRQGGIDSTSIGFLGGAAVYTGLNWILAQRGAQHRKRSGDQQPSEDEESGSGLAIAIGSLLDGIPESIVIGLSLLEGGSVSVVAVAAVFLSNVPEGLSSAAGMRKAKRSALYVFGLWTAIACACGVSSLVGYAVFQHFDQEVIAATTAIAAGAILAMLVDTMIPEAFAHYAQLCRPDHRVRLPRGVLAEQARRLTGAFAARGWLEAHERCGHAWVCDSLFNARTHVPRSRRAPKATQEYCALSCLRPAVATRLFRHTLRLVCLKTSRRCFVREKSSVLRRLDHAATQFSAHVCTRDFALLSPRGVRKLADGNAPLRRPRTTTLQRRLRRLASFTTRLPKTCSAMSAAPARSHRSFSPPSAPSGNGVRCGTTLTQPRSTVPKSCRLWIYAQTTSFRPRFAIRNPQSAICLLPFTGSTTSGTYSGSLTYGGTSIGTFSGAGYNAGETTNGTLTVNLSGALLAAVQALIRAVTFNNTNTYNPSTNTRTLQLTV
jgi:ZIP family zinc transporter